MNNNFSENVCCEVKSAEQNLCQRLENIRNITESCYFEARPIYEKLYGDVKNGEVEPKAPEIAINCLSDALCWEEAKLIELLALLSKANNRL